MKNFKSLFKSKSSELPEKTVVVVSGDSLCDKKSLIETVVGKKLEWSEMELCPDWLYNEKIKYASIECFGHIVNIFDLPFVKYTDYTVPYPSELTDLIINADLVAELHCLNTVFCFSGLTELFEQELDGQMISSIIKNRKVFAYTNAENPESLSQWWDSLSEEEKAERNEWYAVHGNPYCSTYLEAVSFEQALCMGLYPYDCPEENIF